MRKPNKKTANPSPRSVSPSVKGYGPKSLQREATIPAQKNFSDDTIIWGDDDAFPLRLAQAVQDSPAAMSCIGTISKFIKGAGFTDKELMKLKINKKGETLWDLHCKLSETLALYEGFSVNFKFNEKLKITNTFIMGFENIRFVKPEDDLQTEITHVKYNPYFGTYVTDHRKYTKTYPLFNLQELPSQMSLDRKKFPGQVYYYGTTKPIYRFYPYPDYWSAKRWIEIDAKIQEFHAENLQNGFFQSVLMTVVGDPSTPSNNPKYMVEYTDDNGVKRVKSTKTMGEEFDEQMSENFSGSKRAGTVFVQWARNTTEAPALQAFPTTNNAELFLALQDLTTKNITIATKTPSVLANIAEGTNLGSTGNEMQKAVELMQANVIGQQQILMQFYNDVLLPNMEKPSGAMVEIVQFNPISVEVKFDKQFWDVLTQEEKREFIRKNFPTVPITEAPAPAVDENGEPAQQQAAQPNEALKNINLQQLNRIQKIAAKYAIGIIDPNNKNALTFDQAKQILLSYGIAEDQIGDWLAKPDEV